MTDMLMAPAPAGEAPRELETEAFEVTLFEDRAEVSRQATVSLSRGRHRLRLAGATALLDDASLRVTSRTDALQVLSTFVRREVREVPSAARETLETLETEERAARRELTEAQLGAVRTHKAEARLRTLLGQWATGISAVPGSNRETLEHWHRAYRTLEQQHYKILDERDRATRATEKARLALVAVELRLQMARLVTRRLEATVELYVACSEDVEASLVLKYRTPCAAWRPEHRASLQGGHLEVSTWATVWQSTGESWQNVRCLLSTARPTQQAAASLLADDVLTLRPRSDAERQAVVVEARNEMVAVAGLSRGTRAVSDMPGVDDGGEPVVLSTVRPATLPSDGRPVRLETGRVRMACEVDRTAWPELGEGVHVRALATWAGSTPLLAGPVRLVGGEAAVGVAPVAYVGKGEPFELGFGVDDSLRVRRAVQRSREVVPVLGTQKITVKVSDTVSNMSSREATLTLCERAPRSDLSDVRVTVRADGGTVDEKDGFIRFQLTLAPNEVRAVTFEYRLEAGPKVVLPAEI